MLIYNRLHFTLLYSGSFEYCFEDQNRDCGTLLLRYYENPEKNLTFTNYDSYITISEIDDNN